MDIDKTLKELKQRPGFSDNVGMMLVHNGVVRAWSRKDKARVRSVNVHPDYARMHELCREIEQREGIFAVLAEAVEGELFPGDDLLFLVVAGDIRENVKQAFADLLDSIKKEAVLKQEIFE